MSTLSAAATLTTLPPHHAYAVICGVPCPTLLRPGKIKKEIKRGVGEKKENSAVFPLSCACVLFTQLRRASGLWIIGGLGEVIPETRRRRVRRRAPPEKHACTSRCPLLSRGTNCHGSVEHLTPLSRLQEEALRRRLTIDARERASRRTDKTPHKGEFVRVLNLEPTESPVIQDGRAALAAPAAPRPLPALSELGPTFGQAHYIARVIHLSRCRCYFVVERTVGHGQSRISVREYGVPLKNVVRRQLRSTGMTNRALATELAIAGGEETVRVLARDFNTAWDNDRRRGHGVLVTAPPGRLRADLRPPSVPPVRRTTVTVIGWLRPTMPGRLEPAAAMAAARKPRQPATPAATDTGPMADPGPPAAGSAIDLTWAESDAPDAVSLTYRGILIASVSKLAPVPESADGAPSLDFISHEADEKLITAPFCHKLDKWVWPDSARPGHLQHKTKLTTEVAASIGDYLEGARLLCSDSGEQVQLPSKLSEVWKARFVARVNADLRVAYTPKHVAAVKTQRAKARRKEAAPPTLAAEMEAYVPVE